MIIGRRLFLSSATFSLVIALAYWFVAHEITGAFLLGFMALALTFLAAYIFVAEREADLWGDDGSATMEQAAGQVIGTYTIRSPLPFWSALAVTLMLVGLVLSPALTALSFIAVLGLGAAFVLQSR